MTYKDYIKWERMPSTWCPGCAIGTIFKSLAFALEKLNVPRENLVVVSGIGCSGRAAGYFDCDSVHATHGRAIPVAEGIKRYFGDVRAVDGIDLQAFALTRACSPPVAFIDQGADAQGQEASALVNIGSGITNLVVAASGLPQFTRVINLGCEALVQSLVTNRGISHDEADGMRLMVGVTGGSDEGIADLEPETIGEIHQVLDAASEQFADEIRRSIDYYHSQEPEGQIGSLLISGEGALTRHMPEYLSEALHLPVSLGNALQHVGENKTKLSQPELETMAPRLAIAIGLALEDEE